MDLQNAEWDRMILQTTMAAIQVLCRHATREWSRSEDPMNRASSPACEGSLTGFLAGKRTANIGIGLSRCTIYGRAIVAAVYDRRGVRKYGDDGLDAATKLAI